MTFYPYRAVVAHKVIAKPRNFPDVGPDHSLACWYDVTLECGHIALFYIAKPTAATKPPKQMECRACQYSLEF